MDPTLQRILSDCLSPSSRRLLEEDSDNETAPTAPRNIEHFATSSPHTAIISQPPLPLPHSDALQEEREQALRDYKVTIEFKHLISHAPGGVYVIPSIDDFRLFYGVIFVRRGSYSNGIFKFSMKLPPRYNDHNTYPEIKFSSYLFNPFVDPDTGLLDIATTYPHWDPAKHYLVTVLTFLKKIFYAKSADEAQANPVAKELLKTDPSQYRAKVEECVRLSQKNVYENDNNVCQFTEEELSHRVLRDLLKANVKDPSQMSRTKVLSMIEKASHV